MKQGLKNLQDQETEIQNEMTEAGTQKDKYKAHCDAMKSNIKANREKYRKQEKEFEGVVDDEKPEPPKEAAVIAIDGEDSQVQS